MMLDDESNENRATPANSARMTGAALESHYRFILWLVPAVERFPRSRKFLLGDRIQTTALDVLERLIEATYTRRRSGHLAGANLGLEKLRFMFRLAWQYRFWSWTVSAVRSEAPWNAVSLRRHRT